MAKSFGRSRRKRRAVAHSRPALERLEDRLQPTVYLVTNANDTGPGSLRGALDSANFNADPDQIVFDSSFFNVPRTISLDDESGALTVSNPITINGPGSGLLTVRRAAGASTPFRVFNISRSGYSIDVTLAGMTISGGALQGSGGLGNGAGIFVGNENVALRDCLVTGNSTVAGSGAGVFVFSYGQLTLINSTVTGNSGTTLSGVPSDGGGIAAAYYGDIKLINSTVSNNSVTGTGGGLDLAI